MADRTVQILPGGQSSAPYTYTIPSSTAFGLLAIRATFDGTSAAGPFLPTVQLISDAGVEMAQTFGTSVAAGASADASFFPEAEDATLTTTGGTALFQALQAAKVKALYKLDELSGTTAADSSGNGYDATTYGTRQAPTWGQPSGPPGTSTAYFSQGVPLHGLRNAAFPALTADWTILGWFMQDGDVFGYAAGQGGAIEAGSSGFAVGFNSSLEVHPKRAWCYVADGVGGAVNIASDNVLPPLNWYMVAATRTGTTERLYVNAALQLATMSPVYASTTGTWLGNNGFNFGLKGWASWVGYFDYALTGGQIAAIQSAASL